MVLKFQPVPAGQVPGACSGKECEEAEKAELTVLYEADAAHEGNLRRLLISPPPFLPLHSTGVRLLAHLLLLPMSERERWRALLERMLACVP